MRCIRSQICRRVLALLTRIDPLTYGVDGMRTVLTGVTHFGVGVDAVVLIGVAIALLSAGAWRFSKIEISSPGPRAPRSAHPGYRTAPFPPPQIQDKKAPPEKKSQKKKNTQIKGKKQTPPPKPPNPTPQKNRKKNQNPTKNKKKKRNPPPEHPPPPPTPKKKNQAKPQRGSRLRLAVLD